jgi:hypothetical protein
MINGVNLIDIGENGEYIRSAEQGTALHNFSEAGNVLKDQVSTLKSLKPEHKAIVAGIGLLTALGTYVVVDNLTKPKSQVDTPTIQVDGMMQQQSAGRSK